MLYSLILLADQQAAPGEGPPVLVQFMPLILMGFFAYLLFLKPMQRQEQQRKALVAALKKNDKVVNAGGIIGVIDSIKDKEDEVILKGGLHILKSSIVRVLAPDESVKEGQDS